MTVRLNRDVVRADHVPTRSKAPGRPRNAFLLSLALASLGSLWMRTGFPARVIATANSDDMLFLRLARDLLQGHWLGWFDNLTMVKGAGYSLFVALAFVSGVPLKLAESIVYLAFSALAAVLVLRTTRSYRVATVLFFGLAFNPLLWSNDMARVIREGLYVSLSLGVLVLTVPLVFPRDLPRYLRVSGPAAAGVTWAWFWLTREEGVWLIPAMLVIVVAAAIAAWLGPEEARRSWLIEATKRFGGAALIGALLVALVAMLNYGHYGVFQTVEVKSIPFERAYGALYRIKAAEERRFIVFPGDVRAKLYAVSPAARELKPSFEGRTGNVWRRVGCEQLRQPVCPEILSGWFQWALRDAVAEAGHYRSATAAQRYYTRLADEVDRACAAGRLDCLPSRTTLAPPFSWAYVTDTLVRLPELARIYLTEGLLVQPQLFSVAGSQGAASDAEQVMRASDFIGGAQPTAAQAKTSRQASATRNHGIYLIARYVSLAYTAALAIVVAASIPGIVVLAQRARGPAEFATLALAVSCYVGVMSRAVLLCYLDATAIPSLNVLYASPASPLLVVGAVVGAAGLLPRNRFPRTAA